MMALVSTFALAITTEEKEVCSRTPDPESCISLIQEHSICKNYSTGKIIDCHGEENRKQGEYFDNLIRICNKTDPNGNNPQDNINISLCNKWAIPMGDKLKEIQSE